MRGTGGFWRACRGTRAKDDECTFTEAEVDISVPAKYVNSAYEAGAEVVSLWWQRNGLLVAAGRACDGPRAGTPSRKDRFVRRAMAGGDEPLRVIL
jgi:hypothetical protein